MAHFAELNENNNVIRVLVVDNEKIVDELGNENEQKGIFFLKSLFGEHTKWVQTSYNGNIRGKYACIDDHYDQMNDVFTSFNLNEETEETNN